MDAPPLPIRTQLILPATPQTLGLAEAYVREMGSMADLSLDELGGLASTVMQACRHIIQLSYEPGDSSTLSLACEVSASEVAISIQDHGLPLDVRQQSRVISLDVGVDRATWLNHGPDGCELRLVKHRTSGHITDKLPEVALTSFQPDTPHAPEQTYEVRPMRPEEAIGVAQCVYRTYGYSYVNKDIYFPDRFRSLHEAGKILSAVAVDEAGAIVGHCALQRPDLGPVAEIGQAVVAPAHRGRRLFERMRDVLMDEAGRLGLAGVFGDAVATHTFSQRGERDCGARPVGLLLGFSPAMDFKQLDITGANQRISCVSYFKAVAAPKPGVVYIPRHHQAMIERLYAELGQELTLGEEAEAREPGQIRSEYLQGLQTADGDVLRLQYLNCELDPSMLDILEPIGQEIRDYVLAERNRVGRGVEHG